MNTSWWDSFDSWEEAEKSWDNRAKEASRALVLDFPKKSPEVKAKPPFCLRLRAFFWVLYHDKKLRLIHFFLRHPFRHFVQYAKSFLRAKPFESEGSFFYYGIKSLAEMQGLMREENTLLLVGFSYCEKPKECPSTRFSASCCADLNNKICQQCFIGKVKHALPRTNTRTVIVPTINAIGEEVVLLQRSFPQKKIIFLIVSCEMALTMFGDLGNMVGIQGVGVRLGGRVCNTMKSFALSEQGIKPGITWLLPETEKKMLELVKVWRKINSQ